MPCFMLLTPLASLQSMYGPTNALLDTPLMSYINYYMFRHRDAVLSEMYFMYCEILRFQSF